ncbi:hypothetical protein DFH08DRAFT_35664 [Mycena albidolilacea]|uniref:F-box domain-containing protein n=1 Tax=Mycena albidolilacea TaxID=1033008 RepID=A0AAD7F522_9AGAR|nr:hypothetical protein DFH08DRAFT_35664 [Mycena albidolilacea]
MASSASRKRLHDLVEDVLIDILIECDVAGVLALSETSRFFHHLAFTNTVWHSLVTELVQRGFIDRRSDDEDLKDLSTEQLIGIVKRMLHGPKAWADRPSNFYSVALRRSLNLFKKLVRKPAVEAAAPLGEAKRIVLHPEIAQGPAMSPFVDTWNRSKLLPGGKYVLFLNSARLECWSVFEDRLVWKHIPSLSTMDHTSVIDFEVEMAECEIAVIGTCQRTDPGEQFVEITTVNFTTGVSDLELVSRVPEEPFDFGFECAVCGDIVAVYLRLRSRVLLINWRTSSRILISAESIENSQIAVIPDYLVVTLDATHGKHRLTFSPFASIAFWEPNDHVEPPSTHIPIADLPFYSVLDEPLSLGSQPPCRSQGLKRSIWVHENPLQRGRFKIWLHTWFDGVPALCSFECVKHNAGVSWRPLSTTPMPIQIYPRGMSLSGHTLGYCRGYNGLRIVPPDPTDKESARRQIVEFTGRAPFVYLSSFSGALTYSTDKELVVVYYD